MSIKRLAAIAAVALVAVLTTVGLAGAGTYTTGFESFNLGTVIGQNGWHSAMPGDIPALPNGYDQAVVDTSSFGSPSGFGTKALRVSNAYTEPSGEFFFQTYSPSIADGAGETQTNTVFDGTFQFIPTQTTQQNDLFVSVSPDNGVGARMSYVGLEDTANGIHINFYETDANGNFVEHSVGDYDRDAVHTIRFLIQTVPGPANDIVQLFVDGVDIGARDGLCFTTWEQYYREGEKHEPGVINSFEFRTSGSGATLSNLIGQGYLFDNVDTETRTTDGPSTNCGAPTATLNVTKFYDANANGQKDGGESDITGWKVQVANGSTDVGVTPFTDSGLAPGDYTASEFSPIEPNWIATTPTSVLKTLVAGDDKTVSFGNVCTGAGGGLTIGFWTNKNGQALIGPTDLALLVGLNLRNADGSNFDPGNKTDLKRWLSKATATNMAYMLSAQLAAMELNVENGKVLGSALVYAPDVTGANDAGFITVNALMAEANTELGLHGLTLSDSQFRSYQETLKNALDHANNNTSFAQSSPCTFSFPPGPCEAGTGDTGAAYNAIPSDVVHCGPPAEGFEANSDNEFGDEVTLDTTGGTTLDSMTVDFQSYGCSTSGHWNTGDCVSSTADTFTIPGGITATIYSVGAGDTVGPVIATSTVNPNIPFRPSADNTNCTGADAGKWFDSVPGVCRNSYPYLVTFNSWTFPNGAHTFSSGEKVIWTVQFNTSHAGYDPIISTLGTQTCNSDSGGCGYDSLNVGTKSYVNAPYAGTDVNEDIAYRSHGNANYGAPFVPLGPESGWTGYRPLGEIVLGP